MKKPLSLPARRRLVYLVLFLVGGLIGLLARFLFGEGPWGVNEFVVVLAAALAVTVIAYLLTEPFLEDPDERP